MEFNKTYESYMGYVNKCRNLIKSTFFTKKDTYKLPASNSSLSISETIRNHRLKMIDLKLEHTMRMVEQIIKVNEQLGFQIDLATVLKVAILYHDIGRFSQATWSNTYGDRIYRDMGMPFQNHGEEGQYIFLNNDFNVSEQYIPVIGESILHHLDHISYPKLNQRIDGDIMNININEIITGHFDLNDAEWQIASLIVQLVADIDKSDILYQQLGDDSDLIREYIPDRSRDTLDNIAKKWGISKSEILEYNQIDESCCIQGDIRIPIRNVSLEKLEVPEYIKDMFYNNSWPALKVMQNDENWNFISIIYWRLSHFLNNINFNSVLINIEESKLLEQIYAKIPERLKPLVFEAFEYAKEVLVSKTIEQNKGNIYLNKKLCN